MDDKQFEAITKSISKATTRRAALARFAGGLAAALVGTKVAVADLEAKGKKKKRKRSGAAPAQRSLRSEVVPACTPKVTVTGQATNPTCEDIGAAGFKIDPPVSGEKTVKVGDCDCQVTYTVSDDLKKLAFTSTCAIRYVIVKGGNEGANVYDFEACCGGGSKGAIDLVTPTGQEISHFNFCGIQCCTPKTCEDLGCTNGPVDDGCCGRIDCPCPKDCSVDDLGPNTTCDTDEGICVCDPDECAPDTTVPPGGQCKFRDGCCGTYECPCDTACPGGGPNNSCTEGTCVCDPDKCPADKTVPVGEQCVFRDGCCGRFQCPCDTRCPGGGPNNTCEGGTCVCDPETCESLGKTCGEWDNGCCGTIDCGPCGCTPKSCTIGGYSGPDPAASYKKFPCRWGAIKPGDKYPCNKSLTFAQALQKRGKDVVIAQRAAAFLNLQFGCYAIAKDDICNASNAALTAANEQGDDLCPSCK